MEAAWPQGVAVDRSAAAEGSDFCWRYAGGHGSPRASRRTAGRGLGHALNAVRNRFLVRIYVLPALVGLGPSSLLWFWLFDQQVGLFNRLLIDFHIISQPIVWFTDAELALWGVIISVTWKVVGFGMILFVASIQAIDGEITEAAMIDGAT